MILSGPNVPDGVICETPASLIDCHATILDGLGVERASDDPATESRSLFALAHSDDAPDRPVLSQYHAFASPTGGYMLRKGKYKYHYYVG